MISMKKIITCIMLLAILSVSCISCGQSDDKQEDQKLTEPVYETSSVSGTEIKDELEIVDGWVVKPVMIDGKTEYVYYPYIENKKKGVMYFEDNMYNDTLREPYATVNCPKGCKYLGDQAIGMSRASSSQPKLGYNKDEDLDEVDKNPLQIEFEGTELYSDGNVAFDENGRPIIDNDEKKDMLMKSQDVQALSLALYEDFYEEIPQLTVKVYGIPQTLWDSVLGSDMKFSWNEYSAFREKLNKDNFSECGKLAEKKVSETGVYYIDYNEFEQSGDYAQYLILLEFDKSMEYTYSIHGSWAYEISDTAEYNKWKQENSDWMIDLE